MLLVLVEDVVWRGANAGLRALRRLAWVRWLGARLGSLPGWLALPLFLIPEVVGRVGELWAVVLMAHGHLASAAGVYVVVRLLATLMAVFVYQSCEVALMQIGWFSRMMGWVRAVRDWALAFIDPLRRRLRDAARRAPSLLIRRINAIRRLLLHHLRRLRSGG